MELTQSFTLPVTQRRAWAALNDTTILRASIPGCDDIQTAGDNAFALTMCASLGPLKARFNGRLLLTGIDAPHAYTLVFESQGSGFGRGSAHVTLEAVDDTTTRLSYRASAQLGGRLAQFGARFVTGAAARLVGEFFRRFNEQVSGQADIAVREPAGPASGCGR